MIFIKPKDMREKISEVKAIYYQPFDDNHGLGKSREELELEGIFVDSIPEPDDLPSKIGVLHCNLETKELWYEYEDRPLTPEEELERLKSENEKLKEHLAATDMAVLQLMMEGAM